MSLPDISVDQVSQLKVVQLRKYLVQYGASTKGVKRQLKERLVATIKALAESNAKAAAEAAAKEAEAAAEAAAKEAARKQQLEEQRRRAAEHNRRVMEEKRKKAQANAIDLTASAAAAPAATGPTPASAKSAPAAPTAQNGKKRPREPSKFNFAKMRVKELKEFIELRGAKIPTGAVEKKDLIKKCEEVQYRPTIRKRPKVGDRVKLSDSWIDGGPLKWTDIGRLVKDVGRKLAGTLNQPFEVKAPNGKSYWYCEDEIEVLKQDDIKGMKGEDKDKASTALDEAKREAEEEKIDITDLLSCVDATCSAKDIAEVTQKIFKQIDQAILERNAKEKQEGVAPAKTRKRKFSELTKVSLGGQPCLKRPKHAKTRPAVPTLQQRGATLKSAAFDGQSMAPGTKVEATRENSPNDKKGLAREQGAILARNVDGSYQVEWADGKRSYFVAEAFITALATEEEDSADKAVPTDPEAAFKILLKYCPDAKEETYKDNGEWQMDDLTNDVGESRNMAADMKFKIGQHVRAKRKPKFPGSVPKFYDGTIKAVNINNCSYIVFWPTFKDESPANEEDIKMLGVQKKEKLLEYDIKVVPGIASSNRVKVKLAANDNGYTLISKVLLQLGVAPSRNFNRYWLRKPGSKTLLDVGARIKLAKLSVGDPIELGHFDCSDAVDEKTSVDLVVDLEAKSSSANAVPNAEPIRKKLKGLRAHALKTELEKLGGDTVGCVLKGEYIARLIPLVQKKEVDEKLREERLANALYQETQEVLIRPAAVGRFDSEDPSWLHGIVHTCEVKDGYTVYRVYCQQTEQQELVAEEELKVPVSKSRTFNGFTFYSYQSAKLKTQLRMVRQAAGVEIEHREDGIIVSNIHPHPGQPKIKIGDRIVMIREHQNNSFVSLIGKSPAAQVDLFRMAMGYGGPRRVRHGTKNIDCTVVRSKVMWGVNPVSSLQTDYPLGNISVHNSRCILLPKAVPAHLCQTWLQETFRVFPRSLWQRPRSPASGWALQRGTTWLIDAKRRKLEPYKYGGHNAIAIKCQDMNDWDLILRIREHVCALAGISDCPPTACNVNFYEQFDKTRGFVETTGWHSDDTYDNPSILSFQLGMPGNFSVRPKSGTQVDEQRWQGNRQGVRTMKLTAGDIMTMEGEFQHHFQHKGSIHNSVPAGGIRVNFTFRWI